MNENERTGLKNDIIQEIKSVVRGGKQSTKKGSQLSDKHVSALNPIFVDLQRLVHGIEPKPTADLAAACQGLLMDYLRKIVELKMSGHSNEVQYVQPLSFAFINKLFEAVLPEMYPRLTFATGNGNVSIRYDTIINMGDDIVHVKGETDVSVLYSGVCIFVWEDKNAKQLLNTSKEKGQILVEVKACAEDFKTKNAVEAPCIYGVETSGQTWRFCFRLYEKGHSRMYLSETISTICNNNAIIDDTADTTTSFKIIDEAVEIVTAFLIKSVSICHMLIEIIDSQSLDAVKLSKNPLNDEDEDENEDDDECDDKDTPETEPEISSAFSSLSLQSLHSVQQSAAFYSSGSAGNSGDRSKEEKKSGGRNKNRGALRSLGVNNFARLTAENLYNRSKHLSKSL